MTHSCSLAARCASGLHRLLAALLACLGLAQISWTAQAQATAPPAGEPALFPIRQGDRFGLVDAQGQVLLPIEYDEVAPGDPLWRVRKGARTGYVDGAGRLAVPPQEAWTQPFREGLVPAPQPVQQEGRGSSWRWGYARPDGSFAIAARFDEAGPFTGGLAVVAVADAWGERRYGAINRQGEWVLPAVHERLLPTGGGLVRSETRQRQHRVFDARGRDITPPGVDFVGVPSEGFVRVWAGRKQGFMRLDGTLCVAPTYDQAGDMHEGLARVWVDGHWGYVDATGAMRVPPRYEAAEDFADGLALVRLQGRPLFIDTRGRTAFEPPGERAASFSQGLAAVMKDRLWGYVDTRGQWVIAPQFRVARPFQRGLAYVGFGRESGYVRADGQVVWRGPTF